MGALYLGEVSWVDECGRQEEDRRVHVIGRRSMPCLDGHDV